MQHFKGRQSVSQPAECVLITEASRLRVLSEGAPALRGDVGVGDVTLGLFEIQSGFRVHSLAWSSRRRAPGKPAPRHPPPSPDLPLNAHLHAREQQHAETAFKRVA